MKYCYNCGKELPENANVCPYCATELKKTEEKNIVKEEVKIVPSKTSESKSNGVAIGGFVVSLVSLIMCCGSLSWISLILSIVGVSNSKKMEGKGKGLAIAGIVISVIALILLFIIGFLFSYGVMDGAIQEIEEGIFL